MDFPHKRMEFSTPQEMLLAEKPHGLSICLPPTSVKRDEVLAEFEVLYALLLHHKHRSDEHLSALKTRLSDVPHAYCDSPIDWGDFLMTKECFQAIKALRSNDDIYITKPDKVLVLSFSTRMITTARWG